MLLQGYQGAKKARLRVPFMDNFAAVVYFSGISPPIFNHTSSNSVMVGAFKPEMLMETTRFNFGALEKYGKFFTESKVIKKLTNVAKKAGIQVVYAALMLYYTLKSPDIPPKVKATIVGGLGYFILPVDLIPDFMPVIGFTDDLAALLLALTQVAMFVTPEIRFQAKDKLGEWFGTYDDAILVEVDEKLGGKTGEAEN